MADSFAFEAGQTVQVQATGEVVTVSRPISIAGKNSYIVFQNGKRMRYGESELAAYVDSEDRISSQVASLDFDGAEDFQRYAYFRVFSESAETNLFSYQGNKIIFNPFQYKPLLKFLAIDSDERLLVADEVGVGKTIESGIILDELLSRGELRPNDMVLIVCPSMLCAKWRHELYEKFSMDDFLIHDGKSLAYQLEELRNTGRVTYPHSIASEQLVRGERYRALLKECLEERGEPFIRLLIVDECHHYRNPGTNTHKVGSLLSTCSERVLMLSATPFNLRSDDLYNQLHMLNPALFPERQLFEQLQHQIRTLNQAAAYARQDDAESRSALMEALTDIAPMAEGNALVSDDFDALRNKIDDGEVLTPQDKVSFERVCDTLNPISTSFTRTMKRDAIEHRVTREAMTVTVHLSERERDIYDTFLQTNLERYRALGVSERAFGLILNGLERIAASSIIALKENISRFARMSDEQLAQALFPDGDVSAHELHGVGQMLKESYRQLLSKIDLLKNEDSKYDTLDSLVRGLQAATPENPRIIVFSFYTATLRYLRRRLVADGHTVGLLYGATPQETPKRQFDGDGFPIIGRNDIMRSFEEGTIDILLVSEVGGEGLDFQFCSSLVNYDLPYNPMRIEQRIGRIDRMGQKSDKVIVGSLCVEGTVDEAIGRVLLSRIDDAADLVGELEPIIASELAEIGELMISNELTEEELKRREAELEQRIEKERQTREEFEEARLELVNDKAFREEFSEAIQKSRILPKESLLFTKAFLGHERGCNCKVTDETSARIRVSKDMRERLQAYLRKTNLGKSGEELRTLADHEGELAIDFDGSKAYDHPDIAFFKPAGSWVRFMVDYMRAMEADEQRNVFHAAINAKGHDLLSHGPYWLFVYDMEFKGFFETRSFEYVLVNCDTLEARYLLEEEKKAILRDIKQSKHSCEELIDFFEDAQLVAEACAEVRKNEISADAAGRNDVKIGSRIEALRRQSQARTRLLEDELIGSTGIEETRIKAAIARERRKTEEKVSVLEEKMHHVGTYALDAVCLIEVR